jgi:hypothetical protein
MMKIVTRHILTTKQKMALNTAFGSVNITTVNESLPSTPREAVEAFDDLVAQSYADVVADVVLPINLLEAVLKHSQFVKNGGIIIRSVMDREIDSEGNAKFTFSHYEKVVKVEVVTELL